MIQRVVIKVLACPGEGSVLRLMGMAKDHRLITTGPCALVRHPSYLGYFLMFIGFLFTAQSIAALAPIAAIPGYIFVAGEEEEMLLTRFGDDYVEYVERTGRFIPRTRG
jgi:protein-S-isoprenylcysteine O-methyltransferase Ste14